MISLLGNKVLVFAISDPDKVGSIYVPSTAKERADQGIVKYVGPEVKDIKPGDYVLFSGWTGTTIEVEGGNVVILPEDAVELVLHPPATEISGLYHKDKDGNFFPATYESTILMIRQQYWEMPRFANIKGRSIRDA